MTDTAQIAVEIIPDMLIPLPDGTQLSARVWMPASASDTPLPAIIEYLPYRKSDGTAARDHGMHAHFAAHGYVCLRIDRRGCGESEGLFDDEYSEGELSDGVDLIHWIAEQPWCNGRVGIQGISWGGFTGVQIAARAPEPLRAVISIGTTADRYHDDIHYKGGIQLSENIGWAATITSWLSTPPDPALRPDTWRETWLKRLEHTPFVAERWVAHPTRDAYWKHGSICEDYAAIKAPVLAICGQQDGYRNAPAAMAEGLNGEVKAILGPWGHKYPNISTIGPSIDYLGEALRWWDRWLKDAETGVEYDSNYRAYVMDSIPPNNGLTFRPGSWRGLSGGEVERQVLGFSEKAMGKAEPFSAILEPDLRCGEGAGEYFPFGLGPFEMPEDQIADDARSLCFDTVALVEDTEVIGAPKLSLTLRSDTPKGQVIARLCDLRPDGTSHLISIGLLNLAFREGFETAEPMEPGADYQIALSLDQAAYRLPKGHRLRVALSSSYWPYCWPEPGFGQLTVTLGALELPILTSYAGAAVNFDAPKPMEERKYRQIRDKTADKTRTMAEDGTITLRVHGDHGAQEDVETGLINGSAMAELWSIHPDDPSSAVADITWDRMLGRGDWKIETRVTSQMRGLRDHFEITQTLEAWENGTLIFARIWAAKVPR